MKAPDHFQRDVFLVAQMTTAVSVISFFYQLQQGNILLYGDAVAHINIARRVFDSRTPGLLQLGTVWLPLPHLLMLPFLISRRLWQTGMGGSVPSLIGYVLSVVGVCRLMQIVLSACEVKETQSSRLATWLAVAIFAANPNLIYLQTTAMTEPVYLPFFLWSIVFFAEALRRCRQSELNQANSALVKCGFCLAGASLTRYDGWLLSVVIVVAGLGLVYRGNFTSLRPGFNKLVLLAAAGPVLWLAYNAAVYRNPLEFATGPYSAKAIELKSNPPGLALHPGSHNLPVAFQYFFKSAELNLAPGVLQMFWVSALLLGTAIVLLFQRKLWPLLLLWIPVPFYMLSIAYGGVPLYVPTWWPFSLYNVRYGIEMLPAFAVFPASAAYGLMRFVSTPRARTAIAVIFLVLAATSYVLAFRAGPVSFKEAVVNSRSRVALEKQVASIIETLPDNTTFLMYLGDHVGIFQRAGIPLSHVINEGNHRPWKRPTDPDGLWERALAQPAEYANIAIAFDSDPVAAGANKSELQSVLVIHVTGQPPATIYRTLSSNQPR
jgi:hypothetical protein